jgi:phenylalanyl-tRNA synthetase beta chain
MLECGQPLHAFDHALLRGSAIQVRPARDGEILHTLDGQARALAPRHLVIADAERPVALAGVMGGADSEIRDETRTVLLESAAFDSVPVRASAKEFHLHTESSHRFARGCDAHNAEWVSRRAAHLLQAHAGATVCGGAIDMWPSPTPRREIRARWERITRLIGVDIPVDTLLGFLRRLGLEIVEHDAAGCLVRVPGFRNDLLREVDLTEEIARLHGLDRIPSPAPIARVIPGANDRRNDQRMALCRAMAGMGLFEAFHYSLTSPELLASLDPSGQARQVRLPNPISQDQAVLRTSLIPQMVETLARNKARQNLRVGLFEMGTVFHQGAEGVEESQRLSIGLLGPVGRSPLDRERPVGDAEAFYWLKGMVENLLASRRLAPVRWEASDDAAFAPGQAARVLWQDQEIGRIGLVRADIRQGWKIHEPLAVGEIAVEALLARANKPVSMQPVPSIPCSSRDVALIVDRATAHAAVMDLVAEKRPAELESVELFDIFEGKKLGENRKSMAYRFTYRGRQQTLSDEAVEKLHRPIVERLMARLPAEIAGQNATTA